MADITITAPNAVYIRVDCTDDIAMELSEQFCFEVPGFRFTPAFKHGSWDGKLRLFNRRNHQIYRGLILEIKTFAENREYTLDIDPAVEARNEITPRQVMDFALSLKLHARGEPIVPRDYQLAAVYESISRKKILLLSPTASGKSLIIYMLIRWFLQNEEGKVLLIVPTVALVRQMCTDFADYSSADDSFDAEKDCHLIYSGQEKSTAQRIVISTWQSIHKLEAGWFAKFGLVIGDEAHSFKAKCLTSILEKMTRTEYRVGTTGTLDGALSNGMVLAGVFGPVYRVTSTKALMDNDTLAQLKIFALTLQYPEQYRKAKVDYQAEIDFLVSYAPRNVFIANLAIAQTGNTLILFTLVEKHGAVIYKLIRDRLAEQGNTARQIFYLHGGVDAELRNNVRAVIEKEKDAIIIASTGVFSTGINLRNLHQLILAAPTKSQIRLLQSIGRGLRKSDNGEPTKVYDISDDLSWKSRLNHTLRHAQERVKIYAREKFDWVAHQISLA